MKTVRTLLLRQQCLVQRLAQNHGFITASELARELGVSVRTIHRDVDRLAAGGWNICGVTGSGFILHRDEPLAPMSLTRGEADVVLLALDRLRGDDGADLPAPVRSVRAKVVDVRRNLLSEGRDTAASASPKRLDGEDQLMAVAVGRSA